MKSLNKLSMGLFPDTKSQAVKVNAEERKIYETLNLKDIIQVEFPDNQYYKEQTKKNQIVLHHTVSGRGVNGDIAWWLSTADRIATAIIVDWEGKIYQCFSSKYWAHHLGIKSSVNKLLNQGSIGIEIDSWGGLVEHNNKWYPAKWDEKLKKNVPNLNVKPIENVVIYPKGYRGYFGYERYTDAQIEAVRKLLVYWGNIYKIDLKYNEDMWDLSSNALAGKSGIWAHTSFRKDKSDPHPQKELIDMLKSLK